MKTNSALNRVDLLNGDDNVQSKIKPLCPLRTLRSVNMQDTVNENADVGI